MNASSLKPCIWLSIGAALATIALKRTAWLLTGSVGLLSDALESLVNLAGAGMALAMRSIAERPQDEGHAFGHGKTEYFSSGFEGLLILFAAITIVSVGAVALTGWLWPDPALALLIAGTSVWTGCRLLQRSANGLMDGRLPPEQHARVLAVLDRYRGQSVDYHALRTREAGACSFISRHALLPGEWALARTHDLVEALEHELRHALPQATAFTLIEPQENPASHQDPGLDR